MNRTEQVLHELAAGPRAIRELMGLMNCTESQARACVSNGINRLMVRRVEGTQPLQYRLTERGRGYLREGRINHPWARGYKGIQAVQRSAG